MQVSAKHQSGAVTPVGAKQRSIAKPTADDISEPAEQQKTSIVQKFFGPLMNKFW